MVEQPKIDDIFNNFHCVELEQALAYDRLFVGRIDCEKVTFDEFSKFVHKQHSAKFALICQEIATVTQKLHLHFIIVIPDNITYKSFSDSFLKFVKSYGLAKSEFSKKKNGEKHHITKNPVFASLLKKYNMEWYDYAACYYCKDYPNPELSYYGNFPKLPCEELKRRYDIINTELNSLPKKKTNQNIISMLIERWEIHPAHAVNNPNICLVNPDYVKQLQEFIIDEISKNNQNNKMAHLFTGIRLKQYTQTILYTLNPKFAKSRMMYEFEDICRYS